MFFAVMGYLVPEKLSLGIELNILSHLIYSSLISIASHIVLL